MQGVIAREGGGLYTRILYENGREGTYTWKWGILAGSCGSCYHFSKLLDTLQCTNFCQRLAHMYVNLNDRTMLCVHLKSSGHSCMKSLPQLFDHHVRANAHTLCG